jgi:hypothetical protein
MRARSASGRRPACPAWLPFQLPGRQVAERVGDLPLPLVGRVQVDQRRPRAAVAHPRHQLPQVRPSGRGERVSGMAQVVEMRRRRQNREDTRVSINRGLGFTRIAAA